MKCIQHQQLIGYHVYLQVKVGIQGAEKFGDFEEWFNYRLSRAAPETCAEFLGSFVADKSDSMFIKGGKWLVWKFEVLYLIFLLLITVAIDYLCILQLPITSSILVY